MKARSKKSIGEDYFMRPSRRYGLPMTERDTALTYCTSTSTSIGEPSFEIFLRKVQVTSSVSFMSLTLDTHEKIFAYFPSKDINAA